MFVCCECCVLSGRGLCDELITRPVLPTVVRRCVWSRNIKNEKAMTRVGSQRHSKKITDLTHSFFYKMFIWILYMFRATVCSSSGGQLYEYNFWYNHSENEWSEITKVTRIHHVCDADMMYSSILVQTVIMRDVRIPPQCKGYFRSSGMLRSVYW